MLKTLCFLYSVIGGNIHHVRDCKSSSKENSFKVSLKNVQQLSTNSQKLLRVVSESKSSDESRNRIALSCLIAFLIKSLSKMFSTKFLNWFLEY